MYTITRLFSVSEVSDMDNYVNTLSHKFNNIYSYDVIDAVNKSQYAFILNLYLDYIDEDVINTIKELDKPLWNSFMFSYAGLNKLVDKKSEDNLNSK